MEFMVVAPYLQLIGLVVPLIGSIALFKKEHNKVAMSLLLTNIGCFVINFAYMLTFNVRSYSAAYNMLLVLYFGNVLFYFSIMLFHATYLDMGSLRLRGTCLGIWASLELTVFLILLSGDSHKLVYSSIEILRYADGHVHAIMTTPGPVLFIRNGLLCVLLVFAMIYTAIRIIPTKVEAERNNLARLSGAQFVVALATCISLMTETVYDVVPLASAFAILAIVLGVLQGAFFQVTDRGREWVLEHTDNIFVLTNNLYGFLDANAYAKEIFPSLKSVKKNKKIPEDVLAYFTDNDACMAIGEKHFTRKLETIEQAGRVIGYSLLLIDVSYQFNMMEQLTAEKQKAEDANKAKSAFMSNMSHEIRTPMNAIVGMTDIALRDDMPDQIRDCLNNIKSSGNALLTIINDILDFSKIEAGKMEIIKGSYEPMSALNDLSMIFLNRIGNKDIELLYDIDTNLPRKLYGDVQRIRQVIINLINNAIKFTDMGFVKLTIRVEEIVDNEAKIYYCVEDSGQGIKPEDVKQLFGTYQQVDKEKNHYKEGTGLGLAISKQLVELMGGTIGVESEYGKGSKFYFVVPQRIDSDKKAAEIMSEKISETVIAAKFENEYVAQQFDKLVSIYGIHRVELSELVNYEDKSCLFFLDDASALTKEDAMILENNNLKICVLYNPMKKNLSGLPVTLVNKPIYSLNFCQTINGEEMSVEQEEELMDFDAPEAKILVVDDNEMNLKVVKGLLAPLQIQIDTAMDGREAIAKIQRHEYHLVLMDHMMPVIDGVAATKIIRSLEDKTRRELPIIALSANATVEARELFKNNGMNDFIAKPIKVKELYGCIRKWLPEEMVVPATRIHSGASAVSEENKEELQIEGLDVVEGITNSGSKELFLSLLGDFYKLIDQKSTKIEKLLADGMLRDYTIEVHALKSTARMIGAMELSKKFYELEKLGNAEEQKILENMTPKVLSLYRSYKEILKPYGKSTEERKMVPVEVMVETLTRLKDSIDVFDLDGADEAMHEIEGYAFPEECCTKVEELSAFVADVAMEDVMRLSDELIQEILKSKGTN